MTFYNRMAQTSTRLLAKYGQPLTFERKSSTFDAVTGTDSDITLTETDTVGVAVSMKEGVVGGTRIENGDRVYVIDGSYEPALGDKLLFADPIVSALYPLGADSTEVTGVGFLPMTLSQANQKALFALAGAPGAQRKALAIPIGATTGASAKMDFTSGAKVIEWAPTIPASVGGGAASEAYSVRMFLMASLVSQKVTILLSRLADGTNAVDVSLDGLSVYTSTPASFPARIGVLIDADASTASVYFDDVALSLSSDALTGGEWFAALAVYEQTACPAGDAAKLVGAQLYTEAATLTGTTYPDGATDFAGNEI